MWDESALFFCIDKRTRNFWFFNLFLSTAQRRRDKEPTETFWHEEKGASTRILKRTVAKARLQSQPTSSFHRFLTHDFSFLSLNLRLFSPTFVCLVKAVVHFNDSEQILCVLVSLGCFFSFFFPRHLPCHAEKYTSFMCKHTCAPVRTCVHTSLCSFKKHTRTSSHSRTHTHTVETVIKNETTGSLKINK